MNAVKTIMNRVENEKCFNLQKLINTAKNKEDANCKEKT